MLLGLLGCSNVRFAWRWKRSERVASCGETRCDVGKRWLFALRFWHWDRPAGAMRSPKVVPARPVQTTRPEAARAVQRPVTTIAAAVAVAAADQAVRPIAAAAAEVVRAEATVRATTGATMTNRTTTITAVTVPIEMTRVVTASQTPVAGLGARCAMGAAIHTIASRFCFVRAPLIACAVFSACLLASSGGVLIAVIMSSSAEARQIGDDRDVIYRRYRGDDEVSENDRNRGRGRGGDHNDDRGSGSGGDKGSGGAGSKGSGGALSGAGSGNSGDRSRGNSRDSGDRFGR